MAKKKTDECTGARLLILEERLEHHLIESEKAIKHLTDVVKEGFEGINGKVSKNTQWRYVATGVLVMVNALLLPMALIIFSKLLNTLL